MNSYVTALAGYSNTLIVSGNFTTAGGSAANRIAAWDGTGWSALGSGMNGIVRALTVFDGKLIAGGDFTTADGSAANRIAAWDGTGWSALGSGMNNTVYALTVWSGKLIAGGTFTSAGGLLVNRIAAWDGTSWSALQSGMNNDSVRSLIAYEGKLVAGGPSYGGWAIAAWDGTSWSGLGPGMNGTVLALAVYEDKLIAGGAFTNAGGSAANRIAAWDGTRWSSLGSGMGSTVWALAAYGQDLMVGGEFTSAGGKPSYHIAEWFRPSSGITWESQSTPALLRSFPNPCRSKAYLRFNVDREATVALTIYDIGGRLVRTLANCRMGTGSHCEEWDGRNSAGLEVHDGIYFCHLRIGNELRTAKVVVLR
jgi:hypothetical protein